MPSLYALLIGINKYKNPSIPTLSGCCNDVDTVEQFLGKAAKGWTSKPEKLVDEAATKAGILKAMETHFSKAGAEDTLLFYYSGHGCLEEVPGALQRFETGKKLEAFATHDTLAGAAPLSDKELRHQLHKIYDKTKAKILVITDCCHAGGITRNLQDVRKRLGPMAPARSWAEFTFADIIAEEALQSAESLDQILPQAPHVHLAACASHQSALEVGNHGVFTSNLIKVLENSGGPVTYYDLQTRVSQLTRQQYEQTPECYVYTGDLNKADMMARAQEKLYSTFLDGQFQGFPRLANVQFKSGGGWAMDWGAIHGMPPRQQAKELEIRILDENGKKELAKAQVFNVMPGETHLRIPEADNLSPDKFYKAEINGLYRVPMGVQLTGDESGCKTIRDYLQGQESLLEQRNIRLEENRALCDYRVLAANGQYLVLMASDTDKPEEARPVCKQVKDYSEKSAKQVLDYLGHIARYHFIRNIYNPAPELDLAGMAKWELQVLSGYGRFGKDGFEIASLSESPDTFDLDVQGQEPIVLDLPGPKSGLTPILKLKIKIQNTSPEYPLYVGFQLLDELYGVHSNLMDGDVVRLEPHKEGQPETAWGFRQHGQTYGISQFVKDFNWEAEVFYLKLYISTHAFDLTSMNQPPLPPPQKGNTTGGVHRGMIVEKGFFDPMDWAAKTVEVRLKNPGQ